MENRLLLYNDAIYVFFSQSSDKKVFIKVSDTFSIKNEKFSVYSEGNYRKYIEKVLLY